MADRPDHCPTCESTDRGANNKWCPYCDGPERDYHTACMELTCPNEWHTADRPDHDLADRPTEALAELLHHRATQNAIVRSYGIMPSSRPEDDDLDRAAAARLRQLTDENADREREVVMALRMHEVQYNRAERLDSERYELRRQLDTLSNAISDHRDAVKCCDECARAQVVDPHPKDHDGRLWGALAAVGDPEEGR